MSALLMIGTLFVLGTTFVVAAYTPPRVVIAFGKQVIRCLEVLYDIIYRFSYIIITESFTSFGKDLVAFFKKMVDESLVRNSFTQYKFDVDDPVEDPLEEPMSPPKKKWNKPRPDSPARTHQRSHSRYNLRRRPKQSSQ